MCASRGAYLQAALDDRAQQLAGGKWTSVDWRDVQGAPAVESIGSVPGGSVLRQLVAAEGTALRVARLSWRRPTRCARPRPIVSSGR